MLLKNQWVNEEIKKEIKKYLETNDNEDTTIQNLWELLREIHSNTGLPQKRRKISNQKLNPSPKCIRKKEQIKPKVSRRREIIKIKEEIKKIEIKKTIEEIHKTKRWFFEKVNKIDKPLARLTKKRREPK